MDYFAYFGGFEQKTASRFYVFTPAVPATYLALLLPMFHFGGVFGVPSFLNGGTPFALLLPLQSPHPRPSEGPVLSSSK